MSKGHKCYKCGRPAGIIATARDGEQGWACSTEHARELEGRASFGRAAGAQPAPAGKAPTHKPATHGYSCRVCGGHVEAAQGFCVVHPGANVVHGPVDRHGRHKPGGGELCTPQRGRTARSLAGQAKASPARACDHCKRRPATRRVTVTDADVGLGAEAAVCSDACERAITGKLAHQIEAVERKAARALHPVKLPAMKWRPAGDGRWVSFDGAATYKIRTVARTETMPLHHELTRVGHADPIARGSRADCERAARRDAEKRHAR